MKKESETLTVMVTHSRQQKPNCGHNMATASKNDFWDFCKATTTFLDLWTLSSWDSKHISSQCWNVKLKKYEFLPLYSTVNKPMHGYAAQAHVDRSVLSTYVSTWPKTEETLKRVVKEYNMWYVDEYNMNNEFLKLFCEPGDHSDWQHVSEENKYRKYVIQIQYMQY